MHSKGQLSAPANNDLFGRARTPLSLSLSLSLSNSLFIKCVANKKWGKASKDEELRRGFSPRYIAIGAGGGHLFWKRLYPVLCRQEGWRERRWNRAYQSHQKKLHIKSIARQKSLAELFEWSYFCSPCSQDLLICRIAGLLPNVSKLCECDHSWEKHCTPP